MYNKASWIPRCTSSPHHANWNSDARVSQHLNTLHLFIPYLTTPLTFPITSKPYHSLIRLKISFLLQQYHPQLISNTRNTILQKHVGNPYPWPATTPMPSIYSSQILPLDYNYHPWKYHHPWNYLINYGRTQLTVSPAELKTKFNHPLSTIFHHPSLKLEIVLEQFKSNLKIHLTHAYLVLGPALKKWKGCIWQSNSSITGASLWFCNCSKKKTTTPIATPMSHK